MTKVPILTPEEHTGEWPWYARPVGSGTQFTGFTSTTVQILTPEALRTEQTVDAGNVLVNTDLACRYSVYLRY
jgi:hypothetical protein